jgi:hypothetical protein
MVSSRLFYITKLGTLGILQSINVPDMWPVTAIAYDDVLSSGQPARTSTITDYTGPCHFTAVSTIQFWDRIVGYSDFIKH